MFLLMLQEFLYKQFFLTVKTYTYKSLLPKFNTPLPEENSPVDPFPERCFYEKHAKDLKLWKKSLSAFVDR